MAILGLFLTACGAQAEDLKKENINQYITTYCDGSDKVWVLFYGYKGGIAVAPNHQSCNQSGG